MSILDIVLLAGSIASAVFWLVLAGYVVVVQRRRATARAALAGATDGLRHDAVRHLPIGDRVARMRQALDAASREMIMQGSAAADTPADIADTLAAYLVERWGVDVLEREAASHRTARGKWR